MPAAKSKSAPKPSAPKVSAPKVSALTAKSKSREPAYRLTSHKVAVTDGTSVARGFRANSGADADECLVYVNGDRQTGMALPVIGAAIIGGLITDAEIAAAVALR